MITPHEDRCSNCRYWARYEETPQLGECRRRAPLFLAGLLPRALAGEDPLYGLWPEVNAIDWCGEWAALPIRERIIGD